MPQTCIKCLSAIIIALSLILLVPQASVRATSPIAKYVILMISDGWGINHIEATNDYTNSTPSYQLWTQYWMSTYPAGGGYIPAQAWANCNYVASNTTDSAAAATALYTGVKTDNRKISVSTSNSRLFSIGDKARNLNKAVGAVSSVYISHATPGAWYGHNDDRGNGYAIADEGLFGDPNTTGTSADDTRYSGGHGLTLPPADVIIGAGHPDLDTSYVNFLIRDKLAAENGQPGAYTFVERISGSPDGGPRLLSAANVFTVTKLAGLFGRSNHLADGSGYNPENPTLEDMTNAALTVLNRDSDGFVLMVEGGAIDWAGHDNNMDQMIGEQIDFNDAVQAVITWVENPTNGSSWSNTLVIVTGDHETGYLTAEPGVCSDQPLGEVSAITLVKEKTVAGSGGRRASWDDLNGNNEIDVGEAVYWAWNSGGHTNSLIPLYTKGIGSELFVPYATGSDPVRGAYIDNTDVFKVMDAVVQVNQAPTASFTANPTLGSPPLTVNFDATASNDLNDTIVSYAWTFGDGDNGPGAIISHTYTLTGTYMVALTVTDTYSATDSSTSLITITTALNDIFLPVVLH